MSHARKAAGRVRALHTLLIPKRHVQGSFELDSAELEACRQLLHREKKAIEREDGDVQGFNISVNDGEAAGQTTFHCHIRLIPRREHDVEDPRGGVRNVIPGRAAYP